MPRESGFSDVDKSGRSEALVAYLAEMAQEVGERRRQGYELLRLRSGSAVLDVGCGAGEVCVELAARVEATGRVAGVDLSEAMIDVARRAASEAGVDVDLRVASAVKLPFADDTFDAVRAERVFQHLDRPSEALAEMIRVTRPGGRVMVIDPDHGQFGLGLDEPEHQLIFEAFRREFLRRAVNPHSGSRLRGVFAGAGLKEIEEVVIAFEFSHPFFVRAFFLEETLAGAVTSGGITAEQAARFSAALEARQRSRAFCAIGVGYRVAATKP
jgi:ubiquinone/menaquinone biosynthesis C-methylase UbiE